jgi:hypothetical protein
MTEPSSKPSSKTDPAPTRRSFLRRFARAGVALGVLGGTGIVAAIRTSGYRVDPARAAKLKSIAPWQLAVIDAAAARMCAADVPYDAPGAPPTPLEVGVGEFFDAFVAACDRSIARDCKAMIGFVEHAWPLVCGELHRFTALPADRQDAVLAKMESSSSEMVCGAFHSLKSLLMMAYWRDPRTWGVVGYDGPLVNRPFDGWTPKKYLVRGGA